MVPIDFTYIGSAFVTLLTSCQPHIAYNAEMDGHKWLYTYKAFSVCIDLFSHIGNSTNSHILLRRAPFIKTTIYVIPNSQLKPLEFGKCHNHGQMELDGMIWCMFIGHSKIVTQQDTDSPCKILEDMPLYYRLLCSLQIQLGYLWILVIKLAVVYLAVLWYRTVALQQGRLFSI